MLDDGEVEEAATPPKQFKASISGTQQKTAKWFMAMLDAEYTVFEFKVKLCLSDACILIDQASVQALQDKEQLNAFNEEQVH